MGTVSLGQEMSGPANPRVVVIWSYDDAWPS
jgi:hypothetical protein